MDKRLYNAAVKGDVNSLLKLIEEEDAFILDRCMVSCRAETPLHISAMLGHEKFTKVILWLKPELAGELNSDSSTALHLASAKGYAGIVKELLSVNSEMCSKRDRNGLTPFHIATLKGRLSVMRELIQARPDEVRTPVDQGDTILHLCVRHNQLDALKLLMEIMGPDDEFLNSKDDHGSTVLHCAVMAGSTVEMITYLVNSTTIEVNEVNVNGFTALDIILAQSRQDTNIGKCLQRAGALRAKDIITPNSVLDTEIRPSIPVTTSSIRPQTTEATISTSQKRSHSDENQKQNEWTEKHQNALMVVASLIATMAFQVGVNPPGGFWQDDENKHVAGSSIMGDKDSSRYQVLMTCNTVSFIFSLSIILLLVSGLSRRKKFEKFEKFFVWVLIVFIWITISFTVFTYAVAVAPIPTMEPFGGDASVFNTQVWIAVLIIFGWVSLVSIVILVNFIRLIVKVKENWFPRRRASTHSNLGPTNV